MVYPRECGAASRMCSVAGNRRGLSPRVRGSPEPEYTSCLWDRSIPASAGQPLRIIEVVDECAVYPRECGAAQARSWAGTRLSGLSPRVRGSPSRNDCSGDFLRSIPASAGQPCNFPIAYFCSGVYPRECGAALSKRSMTVCSRGLSPRVRGSHKVNGERAIRKGSIPASAGQPTIIGRRRQLREVYPRECGAAPFPIPISTTTWGLSPRVRGSRRQVHILENNDGSIPASAGQPFRFVLTPHFSSVYPRECGAAVL